MFTVLTHQYGFNVEEIMDMSFGVIGVYMDALDQKQSGIREPTGHNENQRIMRKFGIM